MAPCELRPVEPEDGAAVCEAFAAAFEGRRRDAAAWRWAYLANPAGRRAWAAFAEGRVLAHFAAMPARALLRGRPASVALVVDSFARPEARGGGGESVFARTARAFFDAHGGRDDALYFGWPVEQAWRVGVRSLGYGAVRTQSALVLPPSAASATGPEVEPLAAFDEQALWLFERCAPRFSCAVVRDADWLSWRYLTHPRGPARCLGVRDDAGVLRGLAVCARATLEGRDLELLLELLVPEDEPEVARALVHAARRTCAEALVAWLPERSNWFARLQSWGARVHPTPWRMAARSFTPRVDAAWLALDDWFTLGDSDLVLWA
ncbi:MAG TPA: GNAT family N-acetyltransferase [Planctomycetota bacterium]|nr:GNAT family N-acetyltransferase [Planctomycetota bacterium]